MGKIPRDEFWAGVIILIVTLLISIGGAMFVQHSRYQAYQEMQRHGQGGSK